LKVWLRCTSNRRTSSFSSSNKACAEDK